MLKTISVRGAREHNLKNVSVDIPRDKLLVITGLSGSGKSSLAFDTIYAEGQRRYVESLSAYARQFLDMMGKPDVDHISGDPSDNREANLQPLCHSCHSHKTGRERAGLSMVHGCDASGMPRDPVHPWNQDEKSPEGESSSTGRPPFFHR